MLQRDQIHEGARLVLAELDDTAVDVPKAPGQVGAVLGSLVAAGAADLKVLSEHIRTADMEEVPEGEDSLLVGSGNAAKVMAAVLRQLREEAGEDAAAEAYRAAGLDLRAFLPGPDREDEAALQQLVQQYGLEKVAA